MPSTRRDLSPQPLCYKVRALPLCYNNHCHAQVSHELIFTRFFQSGDPFTNWIVISYISSREKLRSSQHEIFCASNLFGAFVSRKRLEKIPIVSDCWCRNFLLNVKIPRFALWGFSISFFCANCRTCYIFINQTRNNPSASPREGSKDDKSVAKAPFKQPLVYGCSLTDLAIPF